MIEIRIIETNTDLWDKAMNGFKIEREVIDHKGKSIVRSYGLPEECLEEKKTIANAADTLDEKVSYLKGFIQQLKKDDGYLVDGDFQSLTKEDELAMKKKLQSAKKNQLLTVTIELVYALMVGFVLWHAYLIAIPLYALTVWHCFRLFQAGKLLPLQDVRKKETKTIDVFLHGYHLPLKYFGFGLVLGCYRLESLSVKFKKYK